jgi:hypothetical protein
VRRRRREEPRRKEGRKYYIQDQPTRAIGKIRLDVAT